MAENKTKYKLWGSFYLVTVTYIYLTRILVEFMKVALPFQYVNWLVELLNEAITLGFYATIGYVPFSLRNKMMVILSHYTNMLLYSLLSIPFNEHIDGSSDLTPTTLTH